MASEVVIVLKGLKRQDYDSFTIGRCVAYLNELKAFANELYKFFADDYGYIDPHPNEGHVARLVDVDITEDVEYLLLNPDTITFEEFSLGVSYALKFKEIFDEFHDYVNDKSGDDETDDYQDLLDNHLEDFSVDLDSWVRPDVCFNAESMHNLATIFENWGSDTLDEMAESVAE